MGVRRVGVGRSIGAGFSARGGCSTFDYVEDPFCDGSCISGNGSAAANSK